MTFSASDVSINPNVRCDPGMGISSSNWKKTSDLLKEVGDQLNGQTLEDIINALIGVPFDLEDHIKRGVLDGALSQGGSATMSVWDWNGSAEDDTTEDITVRDWMLKSGQSISAGKKCVAILFGSRWYVIAAECPT
jgi:hypothetical protein